jgi:hypothetical protein
VPKRQKGSIVTSTIADLEVRRDAAQAAISAADAEISELEQQRRELAFEAVSDREAVKRLAALEKALNLAKTRWELSELALTEGKERIAAIAEAEAERRDRVRKELEVLTQARSAGLRRLDDQLSQLTTTINELVEVERRRYVAAHEVGANPGRDVRNVVATFTSDDYRGWIISRARRFGLTPRQLVESDRLARHWHGGYY